MLGENYGQTTRERCDYSGFATTDTFICVFVLQIGLDCVGLSVRVRNDILDLIRKVALLFLTGPLALSVSMRVSGVSCVTTLLGSNVNIQLDRII